MAPPTVFHIEVDNSGKPFFAGDTISGRVVLHCSEDKAKVKEIVLNLIGKAETKWEETYYANNQPIHIEQSASEEYFDTSVRLWAPSDQSTDTIPAGRYEFPFTFTLPSAVTPTSYEFRGDEGSGFIRYWLEARMVRKGKFNHVSKTTFSVLETVDLNLQPHLNAPRREGYQAFPAFCCKGGAVSVSVSVDKTGYCPGETILVNAQVENDSNNTVNPLKAFLKRKTTLFANRESRTKTRHVAEVQSNISVPNRSIFSWVSEPLAIPVCPPSSNTCKIIHIEYFLEIFASIKNSLCHVKVVIPVTIGTIPIHSAYERVPVVDFAGIEAFSVADNQYTMGQTQFSPLYPSLSKLPLIQDQDEPLH